LKNEDSQSGLDASIHPVNLASIERAQREAEAACLDEARMGGAEEGRSKQLDGELPPIPKLLQLGSGADQQKISEL
jgi:hypothetical protein